MRRIWIVGVLALGCGSPVGPTPATAPFAAVPVVVPAALVPQVPHTLCSSVVAPATWPKPPFKVRVYDFTAIPLALAYGPAETDVGAGFHRYGDTIRIAIIKQTDRLAACMRAAIGTKPAWRKEFQINRGELITIQLAMTIDPFGHAHDIQVTAPPQLVDCVRDTLGIIRVNRRTPRETRAKVDLSFTNLQGITHDKPPPPAVGEPRPGCLVARDPLPIDTLELAGLDIDFDPAPEHHSGRRPRCSRSDVDKAEIREMIRGNLGNLRACYIAAAKRTPKLDGTVTTTFVLGPWGQPTQIAIDGAGDPTFHDCMAAQLALMATQRMPDTAVQIHLPFTLDPEPAVRVTPELSLEDGDLDGAAAMFAKLASTASDVDHACRARAGIVKAYAHPPGGPDARTEAAIAELAAFLSAHRDGLDGCREDARPVLAAIARWPVHDNADDLTPWRGAGLEEAYVRSAAIVAKFPELERELLSFMARALTALHRNDEARELYLRYFALGDTDKLRVMMAADGYAETARMRDDGVTWDTCEDRARY